MPNFNSLNAGAFDDVTWESTGSSNTRHDRNIFRLQPNVKTTVRFLSDPSAMSFDPALCIQYTQDGGWVKYREARAFDGLKGDITLTHRFVPVVDYFITSGGARKNSKDMLQEQIRPSENDIKNNRIYASAKDVMLVAMVFEGPNLDSRGDPLPTFNKRNYSYDPLPGEVMILALSPAQIEAIKNEWETARKYKPDFSFTQGAWELLWENKGTGGPKGWELSATQISAPPLDAALTPLDAVAILRRIRSTCEAEVFGKSEYVEGGLDDMEEAINAIAEEEHAPSEEDLIAAATGATNTERRSPAYYKGMLKKAEVVIPARISNDDLYALALEHGVAF